MRMLECVKTSELRIKIAFLLAEHCHETSGCYGNFGHSYAFLILKLIVNPIHNLIFRVFLVSYEAILNRNLLIRYHHQSFYIDLQKTG